MKKSLIKILPFVLLLGFFGSCKVATPPPLPVSEDIPHAYTENLSDTASIGDISWREFFTDPHLVSLIDRALENNLDLLKAVQRIEMARANFRVREGALLPSLNGVFSANLGNVNQNMVGNVSQDTRIANVREEYFMGLQSSWEADLWGRLKNEKKAAYARFLASEKGRQLVQTSLVAEIAFLYYELLALDNELEVVQKNINFQEIALEVVKIQKMGGRATELAVQQFTAQLLSTKALAGIKQQRIVELENELNLLLGRYPVAIERGADISEQSLPETIKAGIPSDLLLRRPDVRMAELQLAAAKAELEAARAAFLPSFTISPYVGFNAAQATLLFQTPESLALGLLGGLTTPIFNKRRIRSNFDRSVAEQMEAYYDYQEAILTGFGEVVTNLRGIDNLRNVYELKEQEVDVLLNAVSTSNDLFASGYATYLEVITAQRRVLEAELELANIKKNMFHSAIGLYRSLGGGWR